jgi:hypothetical protein
MVTMAKKPQRKLISVDHYWTREEVQKDTAHVYLFGENIHDSKPDPHTGKYHVPSSTQAVIRGLANAIGVPTKKDRGNSKASYFEDTDEDFTLFKEGVDRAISLAKNSGKPIKISMYGLGTGAASVRGAFYNGTGRFFDYLYKGLSSLEV